MKFINNKFTQSLKPAAIKILSLKPLVFNKLGLAMLITFNTSIAMAAEPMLTGGKQNSTVIHSKTPVMNAAPVTYNNEYWQMPVVAEFNKLDSTGNGLLSPNEASKGKAFNKTTFKQTDTDNDGSIDVNEYAFFKAGKTPYMAKPQPVAETKPNMLAVPKVLIKTPLMTEANYFL